MENAHLRLGLLEYVRITEKTSTRIRLRVDRYMGEDRQAHLLSVFGNDSDVGAITAAVHEKATFSLTFPDGETKDVSLGEHASCYKGAVTLPGRKHPVRHLLAVSQELHTNGTVGRTLLLRYRREEAWATLVSFLGLPADPTWADHILGVVEQKKTDRGDRRNRLRAGAGFSDHGGGAGVDRRGAAVRSCGLPVRDRRSRVAATVHCGVA